MYIYRYSLIVCKNKLNKYLCVEERNGLWWVPGGSLQPNQTFYQAAIREAKEETGIDISIKGMIRLDTGKYQQKNVFRAVFYAEPLFEDQKTKITSDHHSRRAEFFTIQQIKQLQPLWRGEEIIIFPNYLMQKGQVYPLNIFHDNAVGKK